MRTTFRILMLALATFAVRAEPDACTDAIRATQPPRADRPSDADRARLRDCDSESLLYGTRGAANAADARRCAMIEEEDGANQDPLHGAGILVAIYANGAGVKRDVALARHYACALEWSDAAREDLLARIDAKRPVDACASADNGLIFDLCAAHDEAVRAKDLEARETAILAAWPAARRDALAPVREAEREYERLRDASEIPPNHPPPRQLADRDGFRAEWIAALEAQDDAAKLNGRNLAELDRRLNAEYKPALAALKRLHEDNPETFGDATSLRDAERAWLRYVDAWEAFRAAQRPEVAADALRALLTEQRVAALHALVADVGG